MFPLGRINQSQFGNKIWEDRSYSNISTPLKRGCPEINEMPPKKRKFELVDPKDKSEFGHNFFDTLERFFSNPFSDVSVSEGAIDQRGVSRANQSLSIKSPLNKQKPTDFESSSERFQNQLLLDDLVGNELFSNEGSIFEAAQDENCIAEEVDDPSFNPFYDECNKFLLENLFQGPVNEIQNLFTGSCSPTANNSCAIAYEIENKNDCNSAPTYESEGIQNEEIQNIPFFGAPFLHEEQESFPSELEFLSEIKKIGVVRFTDVKIIFKGCDLEKVTNTFRKLVDNRYLISSDTNIKRRYRYVVCEKKFKELSTGGIIKKRQRLPSDLTILLGIKNNKEINRKWFLSCFTGYKPNTVHKRFQKFVSKNWLLPCGGSRINRVYVVSDVALKQLANKEDGSKDKSATDGGDSG